MRRKRWWRRRKNKIVDDEEVVEGRSRMMKSTVGLTDLHHTTARIATAKQCK